MQVLKAGLIGDRKGNPLLLYNAALDSGQNCIRVTVYHKIGTSLAESGKEIHGLHQATFTFHIIIYRTQASKGLVTISNLDYVPHIKAIVYTRTIPVNQPSQQT